MLKKIKLFVIVSVAATVSAFGQTPPTLDLHLFAGVNITGATGSVYAIQCTSDVAQANSWTSLAFVQSLWAIGGFTAPCN